MRIAVKGTSGSGKTTTAARIAARLAIPHVELDVLNWGPGWHSRVESEWDEFRRRVDEATSGPRWVISGGYSAVHDLVLGRASHLVWLDYSRARVMRQVVVRSFHRAWQKTELWPDTGNRESFRRWLEPEHPIRWAWSTWARRREAFIKMVEQDEFAPLQVERLRTPKAVDGLLDRLEQEARA